MVVVQVVRVGEHTAAAKILSVNFPRLTPGLPARQVGRLPG